MFTVNSGVRRRTREPRRLRHPDRPLLPPRLRSSRGDRYQPTANFFKLPAGDPAFAVLRQLYNVGWSVTLPARGRLLNPLGPTAGPAWFSASTTSRGRLDRAGPRAPWRRRRAGPPCHAKCCGSTTPTLSRPAPTFRRPLDSRRRDARVLKVTAPRRAPRDRRPHLDGAACPHLRNKLHRRPPRHRHRSRRPPGGSGRFPRLRRAHERGGSRRNCGGPPPRRSAEAPVGRRLGRPRPRMLLPPAWLITRQG